MYMCKYTAQGFAEVETTFPRNMFQTADYLPWNRPPPLDFHKLLFVCAI